MNQKNFSISEIHWSHIFNEFLMSVTPRREENAVFLETGSNSVMLFSIALWPSEKKNFLKLALFDFEATKTQTTNFSGF